MLPTIDCQIVPAQITIDIDSVILATREHPLGHTCIDRRDGGYRPTQYFLPVVVDGVRELAHVIYAGTQYYLGNTDAATEGRYDISDMVVGFGQYSDKCLLVTRVGDTFVTVPFVATGKLVRRRPSDVVRLLRTAANIA